MITHRTLFWLGFFTSLLLLGVAAYFQFVMGIEPCPLCIMQRLCLMIIGLIFFVAWVDSSLSFTGPLQRRVRVYAGAILLFAVVGSGFAIRQIYLQLTPPSASTVCLPGLSYLLKTLPLSKVIPLLIAGSNQCADIAFTWLGLTLPMWTLLSFIGFFVFSAALWCYRGAAIQSHNPC